MQVKLLELDELFRTADYVTLHIPRTKDTENLVNADLLRTMKPTARIVNCARGGVVDEAAISEAINQGVIAGAGQNITEDLAAGLVRSLVVEHQFENPAATKQAHALGFVEQGVPVDAGVGGEAVTFVKALIAGSAAQIVEELALLQGLIAGHQISGQQSIGQVFAKLLRAQAHQ